MALTPQDYIELGLAAFLVLLNGFFVAAEFAIVKIRPTQVRAMKEAGDPRAALAESILTHLDAYLGAIQLGITAASLGLGWVGEPAVAELIEGPLASAGITNPAVLHSIAFAIAFSIITFAHVVIGELAPKSMAIRHPVETTQRIVRPLTIFYYLSWPFMKFFNGAALLLLRAMGVSMDDATNSLHSEAELEHIVATVGESQVSSRLAREVLSNVFWLRRLTVRQIMTHRTQVVALDLEDPLQDSLALAKDSGHSRFPVIRDGIDNVVGVVHLKDLWHLDDEVDPEVLLSLAHPAVVVPETATLDTALLALLDARSKMAVVADEHGGTEGLVTTEDLLEELVGEIEDTFDEEARDLVRLPAGRMLVRGDAALHDVEHILGLVSDDPDVSTVGGLVVKELGRVPQRGESVTITPWRLTAMSRSERRVRELICERVEPVEDDEPELDGHEGSATDTAV